MDNSHTFAKISYHVFPNDYELIRSKNEYNEYAVELFHKGESISYSESNEIDSAIEYSTLACAIGHVFQTLESTATPIQGILVNSHYQLEGQYWLETDCASHDQWVGLPAIVDFGGRKYGKTGWNSDLNKACYSTYKVNATY